MAGIGSVPLMAALKGYKAIGVELEPKFYDFCLQNQEYVEAKTHRKLDITWIKGDSRNLAGLLQERGLVGVTSPPYAESKILHLEQRAGTAWRQSGQGASENPTGYGETEGQIGFQREGKVVGITSLPYGDIAAQFRNTGSRLGGDKFHYGSHDSNNIGNLPDEGDYPDTTKAAWWRKKAAALATETYLEAMLQVYKAAASVCDVLVTITKNPTRDRKLRRLDKDTLAILRIAGFEPTCYHQAVLFQEVQEYDLFGGSKKQSKGRLSFFRRLAYQKGSVVADHEDILICRCVRQREAAGNGNGG